MARCHNCDSLQCAAEERCHKGDAFLIYYEDKDVPPEVFTGAGAEEAAKRCFDRDSGAWSCHLFQRIASSV